MFRIDTFLLLLKVTVGLFFLHCLLLRPSLFFCSHFYTEVIREWLVKPLRDQHVKPKGTAIFTCDIAKDTPNIKWFKGYDEIPLEPNDKTEILKDGNHLFLKIKNAMPEDIDEYAVEVEGKRYPAKLTLGGIKILPFTLKKFKFYMSLRQNIIPTTAPINHENSIVRSLK